MLELTTGERAAELRAYLVAEFVPLAIAERQREDGRADWATGMCRETCAAIEEDLADDGLLDPFRTVHGGYFPADGGCPMGHWWLEGPGGWIVDPTSEQFGLERCVVVPPFHPLQAYYRRPSLRH